MINVRAIYLGNEAEAYILDDFIDGINIINSDDNHVGKTIVMQSIMFAMGSEAMFPHNFKPKEYVFIIDLDVDGEAISILRSRDTFAIKKRDELVFEESKRDFDEFWSDNICALPSIIKDGKLQRVGLPLFNQLSFVNQTPRNTSSLIGSYYKKDDFKEMVFAIVGLDARQLDSQAERELKDRKGKLKTRRKELAKLVRDLRESGTSLAAISPTADREETVLSIILRKFQQATASRRHDHSSSSDTSRYLLDPHSLSATYFRRAVASMSALLPSGKVPTTRVRRRISRFSRSMALLVRMRLQCRAGKRV